MSDTDAPATQAGATYYDVDDQTQEVLRCLLVLDDGRVVVGTGGTARIIDDTSKLARVPSTAAEVRTVLGGLAAVADDIDRGAKVDTAAMRRFVTGVDVWVRGIPGIPDSEK